MTKKVFKNIYSNYAMAIALFAGLYFISMIGLLYFAGIESNTLRNIAAFAIAAIIAFGDRATVAPLDNVELLFLGQETGIWLPPGSTYFLFWVFSLFTSETQHKEKKDVIVPAFQCQDRNGKSITIEANGDWEIVDPEKHRLFVEAQMPGNLQSLVRRTLIRVCGKLVYEIDIRGENMGEAALEDRFFKQECLKYGIAFSNLIADAVASDLKQENLNAYRAQLYAAEVSKYPAGHRFSADEKREIEERIEVALGQAKKIISNAPVLNRHDIV